MLSRARQGRRALAPVDGRCAGAAVRGRGIRWCDGRLGNPQRGGSGPRPRRAARVLAPGARFVILEIPRRRRAAARRSTMLYFPARAAADRPTGRETYDRLRRGFQSRVAPSPRRRSWPAASRRRLHRCSLHAAAWRDRALHVGTSVSGNRARSPSPRRCHPRDTGRTREWPLDSLSEFIAAIERDGELVRVTHPVQRAPRAVRDRRPRDEEARRRAGAAVRARRCCDDGTRVALSGRRSTCSGRCGGCALALGVERPRRASASASRELLDLKVPEG